MFEGRKQMRTAYLLPIDITVPGGCRGGVSSSPEDEDTDYALEIGNCCFADTKMLALCTVVDEVLEVLDNPSIEECTRLKKHIVATAESLTKQLIDAYAEKELPP